MSASRYHFRSPKKKGRVRLEGYPSHALVYQNQKGEEVFWDSSAFRPDPVRILRSGQLYSAIIQTDRENLPGGEKIVFPRRIWVTIPGNTSQIFTNIR